MLIRRSLDGFCLLGRLGVPYVMALLWRKCHRGSGNRWLRALHPWAAVVLERFIVRNRGLTIKIGQYIASRPDIFPLEFVDQLSSLRDQVPPRDWSLMQGVLQDAFEGRIQNHFTSIEEGPIAAASFGQVHRAVTVEREPVAVKIQYPELPGLVRVDLRLVRFAVTLFSPFLKGWPLHLVTEEIARTSREEMDYLFEAQAADRLRPGLQQHRMNAPEVLWAHTRERVLTTTFIDGTTMAQLNLGDLTPARREAIADRLIDAFLHQLLSDGFLHADPHAGNLIYREKDQDFELWLIDYGMTARVETSDIEHYRAFLSGLQNNDTDAMVEALSRLGFVRPGADREKLRNLAREVYAQLGTLNPRTFKGSQRQADLAAKVMEFIRRAEDITFPRHTLMLSRALGLIEGHCMALIPDSSLLDRVRPRLATFINPMQRLKAAWAELKAWIDDVRALPDRLREASVDRAPASDPRIFPALLLIAALLVRDQPWGLWAVGFAGGYLLWKLMRKP